MIFKDVVEVIKSATAQTMGTEYMERLGELSTLDSGKLVEIGRDIEDLELGSKFSAALMSVIGKIVIDSRKYDGELPSLVVENHEWGGFVERILVKPYEVIKDEMYELVSKKDYSEVEHTYYDPQLSVKFFEEAKEILYAKSVSDNMLKDAFRGWDELSRFLGAMETSLQNTITLGLEAYSHMLLSCAIAVTDGTELSNSVHLLTEYKKIKDTDMSPEQAIRDIDFLSFACQEIDKTRDRMCRMTALYNDGSLSMSSTRSHQKLVLHSDFISAVKFILKANTYNDEKIGLGNFEKVVAWQAMSEQVEGVKSVCELKTTTAIDIAPNDRLQLNTGYKSRYAIGVLYDKMAMGVCPYRRKVTSSYTASADFWTNFYHVLVNYLLDTRYPIVSFFID